MQRASLLAMLLAATPALAEVTPEQRALAERSVLSLRAFECSVLAEKKGDPAEQERLFLLGYEEGMTFLRAFEAEKLTEEALRKHAALGFMFRLGGPSHDFRLGRIFEAMAEEVFSNVFTGRDDELQRIQAGNEFNRRSCGLLK